MRVVCISAECEPWAKTGGLGDVVDALARAVGAIGEVGQARRAPRSEFGRAEHVVRSRRSGSAPGGVMGRGTGGVDGPRRATRGRLPAAVPGHARARRARRALRWPCPTRWRPRHHGGPPRRVRGARLSRPPDRPPAGLRSRRLLRRRRRRLSPTTAGASGCSAGPRSRRSSTTTARSTCCISTTGRRCRPSCCATVAYAGYPRISGAAVMVTIHNLAYQGWLSRRAARRPAAPDEIAQAGGRRGRAAAAARRDQAAPSWSTPSAPATPRRF